MNPYVIFVRSIVIAGLFVNYSACKKKSRGSSEPHSLSKGLVSSYEFNGNGNDNSGNNDGTINNAFFVEDRNGKSNSALSFNGTNSSVFVAGNLFYFPKFTYNVWYKPSEIPGNSNAFCLIAIGSAYADHNIVLASKYGIADGFCGGSTNNPGTPDFTTYAIPYEYATVNSWHMITLTRDSENLSLFVNGELKKSSPVNGTAPKYTGSDDYLTIGTRRTSQYAKGVIDDVSIYNRALTSDEVLQLYKL